MKGTTKRASRDSKPKGGKVRRPATSDMFKVTPPKKGRR